jgi:hypothetical protein
LRHNARALLYAGETLSLGWPTYRLEEKIVLRQTADRPIATLDRSRMAMGRSVIAIAACGGGSLRGMLACLNSRLMTTLYRALSGEEGRILPQVKVGTILRLPLPAVSASPLPPGILASVEEGLAEDVPGLLSATTRSPMLAWAALDRLAERMLQTGGQDPGHDGLIDIIMENLYGVTEGEQTILLPAAADDPRSTRRPTRPGERRPPLRADSAPG